MDHASHARDETVGRQLDTAYSGAGDESALYKSFVDDANIVFVAAKLDGTVVFVSKAAGKILGRSPSEAISTNIVEWLHPDDMERAVLQLAASSGAGIPGGITRFRVKHGDGGWRPVEILAAAVNDGADDLVGIYGRSGEHQVLVEEILEMLLHGLARKEVLQPVCNVIQWHAVGSHIAITWYANGAVQCVTTGLPEAICGADSSPGTPWDKVCSRREGLRLASADLDEERRELARSMDLELVWIEPVVWSDEHPPATVTIWTQGGSRTPEIHGYGMTVARNMTELILRFTEQVDELDRAARFDPLTGLANRRAFFSTLARTEHGGALLYCDLDKFKPVNDRLGHAAGDELLQLVAHRLAGCVRAGDTVARLGGDEFAVICEGASEQEAHDVAARIQVALKHPFQISTGEVTIGVSIGLAYHTSRLSEQLLDQADLALAGAKQAGRGTVRAL